VLARLLARHETRLRLSPGETLIFDNRRVLHGRYAFRGRRNLIGCYLTADDWKGRLRLLRAKRHGIY
jgi:trimethyllysine dioxygenase|tara:strand:- start:968 stop:1168 length:201 start_codon:yes stop_codon:yes gene_type:complete